MSLAKKPSTALSQEQDVGRLALGRAGLIEEDERPDHLPLRRRQGAPNLETAKVAGTRNDEGFDRVEANLIGAARFDCWVPTHARHPLLGFRAASPLADEKANARFPSAQRERVEYYPPDDGPN